MLGRLVILIVIICCTRLTAQVTIWQEDFNTYADGTVIGSNNNTTSGTVDWTSSGCNACIDTADWWEIRSGTMEARDVNQLVFLQTESIDISGFSNVEFKLEINESGDHEGLYFGLDDCTDEDKQDFVNVLYRLDAGPWKMLINFLDWCGIYNSCGSHTLYGDDGINSGDCRNHDDDWGDVTIKASGLSGNTLELRIEIINSSTSERISLDNLLVTGVAVLPVSLTAFSETADTHFVLLRWQTASETNNDYFQIERASLRTYDWEIIGKVSGAGNSAEVINYVFKDTMPLMQKSFYRLKQVDFDAVCSYSTIESVNFAPIQIPYPNPVTDHLTIPLDPENRILPEIHLFDIFARMMSIPQIHSKSHILLDVRNLTPGYYFLQTKRQGILEVHRIVVIR
jgi:hypothetical protein